MIEYVYLDTTALVEAGADLDHPKMLELVALAEEFTFKIRTTDVAVEEWILRMVEEAEEAIQEIRKFERIARGKITHQIELPESVSPDRDAIRKRHIAALEKCGMQVVPTPTDIQGELVRMAVSKERPFKGNGTGFKDALILIACASDPGRSSANESAFVSRDTGFDEQTVARHFGKSNTTAHLFVDVAAIAAKLRDDIESIVATVIREERDRLVAFLGTQQPTIAEYLTESFGPSDYALWEAQRSLVRPAPPSAQRVLSLELDSISSAMVVGRSDPLPSGRTEFVATLKVRAVIEVEEISMRLPMATGFAPVALGGVRLETQPGPKERHLASRSVQIEVSMKGTIVKDGDEFRDMVIERMV